MRQRADRSRSRASRRAVLGAGLGAGLGAAVLVGCDDEPSAGPSDPPSSSPSPTPSESAPPDPVPGSSGLVVPDFDPEDWGSVRAQFPLSRDKAQFAAFVLSPHTAQVSAAVDYHRTRLGVDTPAAEADGPLIEDEIRQAAARFVGGEPGQIALTGSTTMGLALMYGGLSLSEDDEVLTTTHDFFATEHCLRLLRARTGATVRRVTLYDAPQRASVDEMVGRLVAGVGPRTRVVALTWVHSSTGVRLPVKEIGAALRDVNAERDRADRVLLCVDGVHGFAAVDTDVAALGCDFLTSGTHKWLFGPRGTGLLWARDWKPLTETIPSFSGDQQGARLTPGGFHAFEHRWAVREAFDFYERIGRPRIVDRTVDQATQLKEGLAGIGKVRLTTPASPEVSAGIVVFDVEGTEPIDVVQRLAERGVVATIPPYDPLRVRLGPSIVTSPEDVDAAVAAVGEIARS